MVQQMLWKTVWCFLKKLTRFKDPWGAGVAGPPWGRGGRAARSREVPPVSPRLYMIHQLNFGECNQNKI